MDELRIGPVDGADLRELAAVMVEAFADEGIHRYVLDFSRGRARHALLRPFLIELESMAADGDTILAASVEGRIVGGAMLTGRRRRPLRRSIVESLRWLRAVVPLLPVVRWRRVFLLHRASRLSRPIVGSYFVLPALVVHPAFQGHGIGRKLLQTVHDCVAKEREVPGIYLYTGERKNQLMYEKAGYRTIEVREAGALNVYHMFRTNGGQFTTTDGDESAHPSVR